MSVRLSASVIEVRDISIALFRAASRCLAVRQWKPFFVGTLGFDRAVMWSNALAAWMAVRGFVQAFLIMIYLSPEQQGIWYTFTNLAALSVFADLGFTTIVSIFVSHEYAKLFFSQGRIAGEPYAVDRFISLSRAAIRGYAVVVPAAESKTKYSKQWPQAQSLSPLLSLQPQSSVSPSTIRLLSAMTPRIWLP